MQLLEINTRLYHHHGLVSLRGELDISGKDELRSQLRVARRDYDDRLILDLSELSFIDSTGLYVLIECDNAVRRNGGTLSLVAPQHTVTKVLKITGLDARLRICDRVDDAVTEFWTAGAGSRA